MFGLGTILNVGGIVAGGLVGMLFCKLINPRIQETLIKAMGICVIIMSIAGAMEEMLTIGPNGLTSGGTMMMIVCMALGALLGEIIDIDKWIEYFGNWLKVKTGNSKENTFVDGFVSASLTVCVGAMAIVGAIQDGISGDYSTLALKTVLDFISVCVMTSALGKGCIFSAIPVALFQGIFTLLARVIEPVMTQNALSNLSLIGSILIFCVGVNLVRPKSFRVANMLPAMLFAVVWAFLF